ncbi:hypothetical protein V8687_19450 [Shewanella baltica]|uniref:hypothetical protein n=1 Tax=Shewanella baltica TaxID=62322 RepID=UPI0030D50E01
MAKKSHLFAHLLKHFRAHHAELLVRFREHHEDPTELSLMRLTEAFGALDCLYWQSLGCGEVLLAKKIARTIKEPVELTYSLIGNISIVTPCRDAS